METSPLICLANQWSGFYMITTSVMKELRSIFTLCKNQSLDLMCKSIDWVLYFGNIGRYSFTTRSITK